MTRFSMNRFGDGSNYSDRRLTMAAAKKTAPKRKKAVAKKAAPAAKKAAPPTDGSWGCIGAPPNKR